MSLVAASTGGNHFFLLAIGLPHHACARGRIGQQCGNRRSASGRRPRAPAMPSSLGSAQRQSVGPGLQARQCTGLQIAVGRIGLIDSPSAVDSRALINRQLDRILWLNGRLSACMDGQRKAQMFRELCDGAMLHVLSRERVLLPAWRRIGWKKFPLASFRAHVQFKRHLAELVVRPPSVEGHSDALDAFASHVEHQRALDDECLVPSLRSAMDVPQRRDVCNDMELLFGSDRVADAMSPRIDASPRELVHEAQVVLSSLAPHRESGRPSTS